MTISSSFFLLLLSGFFPLKSVWASYSADNLIFKSYQGADYKDPELKSIVEGKSSYPIHDYTKASETIDFTEWKSPMRKLHAVRYVLDEYVKKQSVSLRAKVLVESEYQDCLPHAFLTHMDAESRDTGLFVCTKS